MIAKLEYYPNYFKVIGPEEFQKEFSLILKCHGWEERTHMDAIRNMDLSLRWGIKCRITQEFVSLSDLQYWSISEQVGFKGVEQALLFSTARGLYVVK